MREKLFFEILHEPIFSKKIEIVIQIEIENFANFNCATQIGNKFVAFQRHFIASLLCFSIRRNMEEIKASTAENVECKRKKKRCKNVG